MSDTASPVPEPAPQAEKPLGMRKNGKQWHAPKKAFRPTAGLKSYEKRSQERALLAQIKAKEKEMKDEKEQIRQDRIQAIKAKREKKEEKERYEMMAEKMHRKTSRAAEAQGEAKQADQLLIWRLAVAWTGKISLTNVMIHDATYLTWGGFRESEAAQYTDG
ncbi:rRNA-processing protein CGR1 [Fusarium oligoseptatum]|uniref:rRNA-processing protein CGR1 n=1 Tax=Fusarium oligoseptatum TaxID=2604345 RepID=A0A428TJN2_9HYPO|nr:rRNA-processing protein CGR1 [Fusarium oligoseptatum]